MSADPMNSPVPAAIAYLEPVPARSDELESGTAELRRQLETERSASRAVLSAMRELEARLAAEREQVGGLTVRNEELQRELAQEQAQSEARFHEVKAMWAEVTNLTSTLQQERSKPVWRRLLGR